MKRTWKSIINIVLALIIARGAMAWFTPVQSVRAMTTWYVAPGGIDSNDCAAPSTACGSIYIAIQQAEAGDIVQVAEGSFTNPASSTYMIEINKNMILSGGWDTAFTTQKGFSTIEVQNSHQGLLINNSVTTSFDHFIFDKGGISNRGTLTLTNSVVKNSSSQGIMNAGTMVMVNDTVMNNVASWGGAGGIGNSGDLTMQNTLVSNNESYYGYGYAGTAGGIGNSGNLTIDHSSIIDNYSSSLAGGIHHGYGSMVIKNSIISNNESIWYGGGIYIYSEQDPGYISNSTISNNIAPSGEGIYFGDQYGSDPLYLNNVTVSENVATSSAGGIYSGYLTHLQNSIIANNSGPSASPDCSGIIQSEGYNLIQDLTGCTLNGDLSDNRTGVDPQLLPFVEDKGYYPLSSTSPAVDAGNPTGCTDGEGNLLTTDQRGAPRNGRCDIGAYEYTVPGPAANLAILSGSDQSTGLSETFPAVLQLRALDNIGSPVNGASIIFSAPADGPSGTFEDNRSNTITVTTDEGGSTPALFFKANDSTGSYSVVATNLSANLEIDFHLTNLGKIYLPMIYKSDPAQIVDEFPFTDHCASSYITYNGQNEAKVTQCVTNVRIRLDGQMYFDMRWSAEFLDPKVTSVYIYPIDNNSHMYVTDNLGNRYDHVDAGGAAAVVTYIYPSGPLYADGWFMFPPRQPGATLFAFHDDDQGFVIGELALDHK